jgi:hypothetical protein
MCGLQTYGQVGTGKSRLMQGSVRDAGLLPRTFAYLFAMRKHVPALLSIRMLDLAGNAIQDLLTHEVLRAAGVREGQVHAAPFHSHEVREVLLTRRSQALRVLAEVVAQQRRNAASAGAAAGALRRCGLFSWALMV